MFDWVLNTLLQDDKERGTPTVTPFYYLNPLHEYLYISRAFNADSSLLYIANDQIRIGNLWTRSSNR